MKKLLFLLLLISQTVVGQTVSKQTNHPLIEFLSNVQSLNIQETDNFVIRIYLISNAPGSSKEEGTETVTHHFWITVNEYDTYPDYNLYSVGPFIDPKIVTEGKTANGYYMNIQHGNADHKQTQKLIIELNRVILQ